MAAALKEAVYAKNDEKQAPARLLFDMIQSAFLYVAVKFFERNKKG